MRNLFREATSVGAKTISAGAAEPALPGRRRSTLSQGILRQAQDERNSMSERGGLHLHQPGPRNRLCRAAGAAAPSGGSALHAVKSVGVMVRRAGPPQARTAPSGGSALREAKSVGVIL